MKTETPILSHWTHGLTIEAAGDGLLLKPRRKPREGWAKAFRRAPSSNHDELAAPRCMANQFDAEEWNW